VDVRGGAEAGVALFVSNHRSYLDIPVLSSALPATFLAKADVAAMPLVGRVARHTGAVFVDRDDTSHRMSAARALRRTLRATSVIAFPEGTTWAEPSLGPFASGPFRLARRAGIGVVPVTVRYSDRRAYWVEEVGVWDHLRRNVLRREPLRAMVHIGPRLDPRDFADAADFARAVHRAVEAPIADCGELV
jgi:1-acyl-sn-glycerol-3-phosphate acyltransferase